MVLFGFNILIFFFDAIFFLFFCETCVGEVFLAKFCLAKFFDPKNMLWVQRTCYESKECAMGPNKICFLIMFWYATYSNICIGICQQLNWPFNKIIQKCSQSVAYMSQCSCFVPCISTFKVTF